MYHAVAGYRLKAILCLNWGALSESCSLFCLSHSSFRQIPYSFLNRTDYKLVLLCCAQGHMCYHLFLFFTWNVSVKLFYFYNMGQIISWNFLLNCKEDNMYRGIPLHFFSKKKLSCAYIFSVNSLRFPYIEFQDALSLVANFAYGLWIPHFIFVFYSVIFSLVCLARLSLRNRISWAIFWYFLYPRIP